GFGLVHRRLVGGGVDLEQLLPRLDIGALGKIPGLDDARYLGAHLGDAPGFEAPRHFRGDHHQLRHGSDHTDGGGALLGLLRLAATGGQGETDGQQENPAVAICAEVHGDVLVPDPERVMRREAAGVRVDIIVTYDEFVNIDNNVKSNTLPR